LRFGKTKVWHSDRDWRPAFGFVWQFGKYQIGKNGAN